MMTPEALELEPSRQADNAAETHPVPLLRWCVRHPLMAISLVSVLAVVINCYPVVFCGKSFVSPSARIKMLYDGTTSFPGVTANAGYDHGSDTAAPLLWSVPVGFIESRAVMEHGEIPLWNRYSHAGDTLIGQAVSMLGDPLQMIVIFGHGSAVAWDIKFLLAKFLFCVGFALLIRRLMASDWLSLLFAVLAAYCGAFFYINNHPVFFVFSYSPWILLSALEMLDLRSTRYFGWGLVWLVANFGCFNGGHVEPAVTLIAALNLAAFVFGMASCRNLSGAVKVTGRMLVGTLLFLALTAPVWISFLAALEGAYSGHLLYGVTQLPLVTMVEAFDDVFATLWNRSYAMPGPGTSLLIAVGAIFAILQWRKLKPEPFFWINSVAILFWGAGVFGVFPDWLLAQVPFLNRIHHIYTEFSYPLVLHLTIQCAYGFKCLSQATSLRSVAVDFLWIVLVLAALTLLFCLGIPHRPIPWVYFVCAAAGAFGAPLLFVYLKEHYERISAGWWVGILVLGFIPHCRFGLYTFGSDNLVSRPGPRVTLDARSEALDKIKQDSSEPFRVAAMQANLPADYSAVYGLEDIHSCAPLSNIQLMALLQQFPGIKITDLWVIHLLNPIAAQPLLNLLNVKYVLSSPQLSVPSNASIPVSDHSDFLVLKNTKAWPRAFFSSRVVSLPPKQFISYLMKNPDQPFATMPPEEILKRPDLSPLQNAANGAVVVPAAHYQLLPNSTAFDVHAPSAGVVCLTEGQAKDFTATANGSHREVLTVNRAFKGIYLDSPGDYHIEFTFRPRHWREACILFWTAAALVLILSAIQFAGARLKRVRSGLNVQVA